MSLVEIRDGVFYFNGKRYFLFGGEVQYFRLRDKNFAPKETWAIWEETLDKMAHAGMNFVTTYVPWNYHEIEPGRFDFSGARDLDKFLSMCEQRGMLVQVKPGPYITAEWPYGPRSFGAVPEWLLKRHPETLVLDRNGKPYTKDPLGAKWGRQCTYLHPVFLDKVKKWYEKVAPIILKYIHTQSCVFSVQVDNETNLFWTDRYLIDYHPVALAHYRNFLEIKYIDVEALNSAYGSKYKSFVEVAPPRKPARKGPEKNAWHIDWFEAGWAYVHDYLVELRRYWESLGIKEPDILFTTNDTHGLVPILGWKLLWPRPAQKSAIGLPSLDSYPRNNPLSHALDDVPYQTPFTARLLDFYGDRYPMKKGSYVMGAEMQGGVFEIPILNIKVRPEATARMVTQALGSGVKAYATFAIREGFNLDNSIYHMQAPINYSGKTTPRFDVLENAAKFIGKIGDKLLESAPAEAHVAILVNTSYQVPLAGTRFDPMEFWNRSYGGVFGWLTRAGYAVDVLDIKEVENLSRWKAVVYLDPGLIGTDEAKKIAEYVESGGSLIHIGFPSDANFSGTSSPTHRRWIEMFPKRFIMTLHRARQVILMDKGNRYEFRAPAPLYIWEVPENGEVFLKAGVGGAVGMMIPYGKGRTFYMPFDLWRIFNSGQLYRLPDDDLDALVVLARQIMARCGVSPLLSWEPRKIEAWPRFIPSSGDILLFITNDGPAATSQINPGDAWKIEPEKQYRLYRAWKDSEIGIMSGKELLAQGIQVDIEKLGCEVILIEKA